MKNFYKTKPHSFLLKSFLLTFFACFLNVTAQAQDESSIVDFGKIELDKEYQLQGDFKDYKGYFVAEESGTLTGTGDFGCLLLPYTDEKCLDAAAYTHSYMDNGEMFVLNVEKGKTYYLFIGFNMDMGKFKMTMNADNSVKLISSTPADGSVFDLSDGGLLSVKFNNAVKIETAIINCNQTMTEIPYDVQGSNVAIDLKDRIYGLMENGNLKAGDQFAIILDGIRAFNDESSIYGEDGTLVLTYTLGALPVALDSTINVENNPFLSYWQKNNEKGIVTLIFDDELQDDGEEKFAAITYGELEAEAGEYYHENVPYTIEGNKIKIDFTGKLRRAKDMVASATKYPFVSVKVKDIHGKDGRLAYFPGKGGLGSYAFDMPYEEITAEPIAEFTPGNNSAIDNVDAIEIWVSDYKTINYEGISFSFECDGKKETVIVKDIEEKADPDFEGAYTLNVKIPAEVKKATAQSDIHIAFNNLECIDGLDHNADLSATYHITTAIENVLNEKAGMNVYQLNGVKMNGKKLEQLPRGIYLINGKKVLNVR